MLITHLDQESLDLVLEGADLVHEIGSLVGGDGGGDDGAGDTAGTSESGLGWNVDVWDVLILAEEWEVEENLKWIGVGGEDDDLGDSAVEGLGGLVGALLELAVVSSLLDEIEDLLGQSLISLWPRGATMEVSHGRNRDTVGAHESSVQRDSNIRGISHFRFVCWRVLVVVRVHCLARR